VYAVDVGTGNRPASQEGSAVVVMDTRTLARSISRLRDQPTCGHRRVLHPLEKILPAVFGVLASRGEVVALVKPQFEVGREHVAKAVSFATRAASGCVQRLARYAVLRGWHVWVSRVSARGPKGNHEFFLHFSTHADCQ